MSEQIIDDGFVLHRYPYGETSLIIECFLQHQGRIAMVAKGVRTKRSSLTGLLQPFTPLHFNARGKSQLKTLTLAEASGPPMLLQGMPLMCSWYVNELLLRLLPKEESNPHLYFIYHATLLSLEHDKCVEQTLRIFEKNLLQALGYQLPLQHEAISKRTITAEDYYQFIAEQGFVQIEKMHRADVFLGKYLHAIADNQLTAPQVLQAAKRLMRLALQPLLGGKPLKTRELLQAMAQ